VYYNDADHVMDNYTLRTPNPHSSMPMPMAANVDRRTTGGRIASEWRWQDIAVVAGVDAQDSRHRDRSGMGRNTYQQQPWRTDARFASLGAFSEITLGEGTAQRWVGGLRIDRAEVTDERRTSGMMAMPNPTAGQQRREHLGSGFLRIERDLAPSLTWYAGIGHSERMPDYWELFSARSFGGAMGTGMGGTNAFAGLDTEKTTQLDIGLHYRGRKVDAWVSAYAGRIDDFIQFHYPSEGMMAGTSVVSNIDADIRGAELGVEVRPADHWKLGATLAYARGEARDSGRPLPQMTPLESRLTASWDNGSWSAGALVRVVDGQDRVAPGYGNVVGQDLGASPGFATLALNAGYRFDNGMQLTAGVDNVFDRAYSEHLNLAGSADFGFPADPVRINEPGRTAWMKVNYRY
jgi:iron complex outermembrane receptor protein